MIGENKLSKKLRSERRAAGILFENTNETHLL